MPPRISRMHIGILTGGGDCPGLNSVIRAATLALLEGGARVTGIERGFHGLMRDRVRPLHRPDVIPLVDQGGSILGTHNRADPFQDSTQGGQDSSEAVLTHARRHGLDGVIAIGGDGTMSIASRLHTRGLPMVGVPKTIDNDLAYTRQCVGFDSAVAVATEALGRLHTTARSHGRIMILETMGRYGGWIALEAGVAAGADIILIPERPYRLEEVLRVCQMREESASDPGTLICIAEGAHAHGETMTIAHAAPQSPDPVRLGGVSEHLRRQLEPHCRSEIRATVLGHLQRGGLATAYDRVLAVQLGQAAAERALEGQFGDMVMLTTDGADDRCDFIPLRDVVEHPRRVLADHPLVRAAEAIGVSFGAPGSG